MNAQHLSKNDSWLTPLPIVEAARTVLESIDLDPASSERANLRVRATHYYDRVHDGLAQLWLFPPKRHSSILINPPGKLYLQFWAKLIQFKDLGHLTHAIYIAFSLEQLQTTQNKGVPCLSDFPLCIPSRRIAYDDPVTGQPSGSPTHASAIVYVPGLLDQRESFAHVFSQFGSIVGV